jgi:hypothetical protein
MIALLVAHYDLERGRGIAKTQFSGDDFIFTRDFQHNNPETVLPNIRLIAARGWVETSFDGYLGLLRTEFRRATHYTQPEIISGDIKVNCKSTVPLSRAEIEAGIELGITLRRAA